IESLFANGRYTQVGAEVRAAMRLKLDPDTRIAMMALGWAAEYQRREDRTARAFVPDLLREDGDLVPGRRSLGFEGTLGALFLRPTREGDERARTDKVIRVLHTLNGPVTAESKQNLRYRLLDER